MNKSRTPMTTSLKNNQTVTAILPNYNYSKYIAKRLDDVLNQTYPVSEIIILDDASTDGSANIIKTQVKVLQEKFPQIKIKTLFNKTNSKNVFNQWQKGIKLATSQYIWMAELDDVAKPTFLENILKKFDNQSVVLAYSNSRFINNNGRVVLKDTLRKIKDQFRRNILVYNTIPNISAVVLKNQPNLCEFLDEAKQYKLSGDWYFYIKIFETGKIAHCNKVLNYHRLHQDSVTGSTNLATRFSEMQAIHRYVQSQRLSDERTNKAIKSLEHKLKSRWQL